MRTLSDFLHTTASSPQGMAADILAWLEQTQWLSASQLLAMQLAQTHSLLQHAINHVPLYQTYRQFLPAEGHLTMEMFRQLPIIRRQDLQQELASLLNPAVPENHGRISEGKTSGSTGRPIRYFSTELVYEFWRAFALRDHLWHARDFGGRLAVMRATGNDGRYPNWGQATHGLYETGPSLSIPLRTDIAEQIQQLRAFDPNYILTYPNNLRGILVQCEKKQITFPGLREVRTISEVVDPDLRQQCLAVLGVPLVDVYSADEVGYIAVECPQSDVYHIQAEHLLVEILDDHDQPCQQGETGRVVLTCLLNYAMPLIRYEILDYAEVAAPCPCGRGLPTLKRIMGRERNLVQLPDGSTHWPFTGVYNWMNYLPIRQVQMIQKSLVLIAVNYVTDRAMQADELSAFAAYIRDALGYPFEMTFNRVDEIPRSPGGKYEEFISELR